MSNSSDSALGKDQLRDLARRLITDLARLSQAQAELARDLVFLVEGIERSEPAQAKLDRVSATADNTDGGAAAGDPRRPPAPAPQARERGADPELSSEALAIVSAAVGLGEAEDADPIRFAAAGREEPATSEMDAEAASAEIPRDDAEAPDGAEFSDAVDEAGGVPQDATVLVLESAGTRVGVLWDHVAHVGSLAQNGPQGSIDTEKGRCDLVSLGQVLHGQSTNEKYYVVLDHESERVAVACERMLGLGPLSSAGASGGPAGTGETGGAAGKVQVMHVSLLKTFVRSARGEGGANGSHGADMAARIAEDRDRNGPLRALVAVRYLPARVAICRHLRGRGWQVGEAAGLEAAAVSLDLGRWDALFLEVRGNGDSEEHEANLLQRVAQREIPVVRVGSRISGLPQHEGPAVMFPFTESELDAILVVVMERASA